MRPQFLIFCLTLSKLSFPLKVMIAWWCCDENQCWKIWVESTLVMMITAMMMMIIYSDVYIKGANDDKSISACSVRLLHFQLSFRSLLIRVKPMMMVMTMTTATIVISRVWKKCICVFLKTMTNRADHQTDCLLPEKVERGAREAFDGHRVRSRHSGWPPCSS